MQKNLCEKKRAVCKKDECTGCGACLSLCEKDAIFFEEDEWGYYTAQIDEKKCAGCGACQKVCPVLNPLLRKNKTPQAYAFQHAKKEVLKKSSSGGAFTAFSEKIFEKGGVVFGAAWENDFSVKHIAIKKAQDLDLLRRSKYLQSYMGSVFRELFLELKKGRPVLFVACPCQIAGAKAFLNAKKASEENLILVDLLCGNSPSAGFFKKYFSETYEEKNVAKYDFREKSRGWLASYSVVVVDKEGNSTIKAGIGQDLYQAVYHNHTMCPPHCENCKFQTPPRYGDLTIGDFWGIEKFDPSINFKEGMSVILANNQKGKDFLLSIEPEKIAILKEEPLSFVGGNGLVNSKTGRHFVSPHRNQFYSLVKTLPFSQAVRQSFRGDPKRPQICDEDLYTQIFAYSAKSHFFCYEKDCFERQQIDGAEHLFVKLGKSVVGVRAFLPVEKKFQKGKKYFLKIKFKTRTESGILNLHIYDSKTGRMQVIHTENCNLSNIHWHEMGMFFLANIEGADSVMVGACHLTGEGAFFALKSLFVSEEKAHTNDGGGGGIFIFSSKSKNRALAKKRRGFFSGKAAA